MGRIYAFRRVTGRALARAFGLMFGVALSCPAAAADSIATTLATRVAPSPLLSIDQNRATVVDRIVTEWGDALPSTAGLGKEQLRTLLLAMRADQLLAASLVGSMEGLRNVMANALSGSTAVADGLIHTKALGDAGDDLVYTPVLPCRIVDTRGIGGPYAPGGETRNYHAYLTSGTFATQGGAASNCAILSNPGAVALNITAIGGDGFLTAWPFGTSQPLAATLLPNAGVILANGAIVPTCQPGCAAEFSVFTFGANLVIDIVGYFKAPGAPIGTVSNIATGTGLTGGPITTTGTVSIAAGGVNTTQLAANAVTQAKLSPSSGGTAGKVLGTDGTNLQWQVAVGGGTVTAVTASAPLASSGGSAPDISLAGPVPVDRGGTGQVTLPNNGVLIGQGTGAVSTAVGTGGQVLANTGSAPIWTESPSIAGNIIMAPTSALAGSIMRGANRFIHSFGTNNVFIGADAGNVTMTGISNTAIGRAALQSTTSGNDNTASGASALAANSSGFANTANGRNALLTNTIGQFNTAVGRGALQLNSSGNNNTASGAGALNGNTTGSGNTSVGMTALAFNTTGSSNTAGGFNALFSNTTADNNTAFGAGALTSNTFGVDNTGSGFNALANAGKTVAAGQFITGVQYAIVNPGDTDFVAIGAPNNNAGTLFVASGAGVGIGTAASTTDQNTAYGSGALQNTVTGAFNTATGFHALLNNTAGARNTANGQSALRNATGSNNIALGDSAGLNLTTGNFNISIGNPGVAAEGNTTRIGDANQTRTFVSGIRGVTTGVADAIAVFVDSTGQLGTLSSSRRFKDDIADMDGASSALMDLRPVTFHYKSDQNRAGRTLQYGLIAEEVAEVYPGLVAHSADGKIETVMYQFLPTMLLNQYQKQQHTIDAQALEMRRQKARIDALEYQAVEIAMLKQQVAQMVQLQQATTPATAASR